MSTRKFTVAVLLYGDYPLLATRCLESIRDRLPVDAYALCLGMNEVSAETIDVAQFITTGLQRAGVPLQLRSSLANIHKYPMMRHMLHAADNPITTEFVMWFDDDSYIRPDASPTWLTQVERAMQGVDMIGAIYTQGPRKGQHDWIRDQPWYTGVPFGPRFTFITGGWWCIRTAVLQKYNWPLPELDHRGGDVMLGELFRQQGLKWRQFNTGVAINADEAGNQCRAEKRGFNSDPIGTNYARRTHADHA